MGMPRYAQRRDINEPELVQLARKLGARMEKFGPLDWWMFHPRTQWVPVEIKNGRNKYTPDQVEFIQKCQAWNMPVLTWRTKEDVIKALGGEPWKQSTNVLQTSSSKAAGPNDTKMPAAGNGSEELKKLRNAIQIADECL